MKKFLLLTALTLFVSVQLQAQKYMTRTGHVWFYSETPMETIEAHNNQVTSMLDTETGDMVFAVLMKSFQFEKALMQEHFNEKYVESDKYPKSSFKGSISNLDGINFTKDGTYSTTVQGNLSIHGVTQSVTTEGSLKVAGGKIEASALFQVMPEDYKIVIPKMVRDNIAKIMDIHVEIVYEPFEN
jgi:polyisoprenoid-binding protein YceI